MTAPVTSPSEAGESPPTESTWNPAMSVSYSSMTLHRTCPQAWQYRYVKGVEAVSMSYARDLGHWWHLLRALDSLDRGTALGTLREVPVRLKAGEDASGSSLRLDPDSGVTNPVYLDRDGTSITPQAEVALHLAERYWETLPGDEREAWTEELGEPLADRLSYMNDQWHDHWADELRHEGPVGVEVKFRRPLPGPSGAVLPGYVDEVYLDSRRSLLVVRDHKSHGKLPSQESADDLSDSQLHLYVWGLAPMAGGWNLGPIKAVSYDRARTAKPKSPSLTQSGGLSKSVTDYDLRTYLEWANGPDGNGIPWGEPDTFFASGRRKGEPKFGVYTPEEQVIGKLSTPSARSAWFQRTLVPVNPNIVLSHLRATVETQTQAARTIALVEAHGEAPRNFTRWGCRTCDFAKLCRAELIGGSDGDYPLSDFGLTTRR